MRHPIAVTARPFAPTPHPRRADEGTRLRAMLIRPLPEIPPIHLYDDRGSALFEAITQLSAYYPTRTEIGILERRAAEILDFTRPRRIVELGSGAGRKIRLLLDAWRGGAGGVEAGTCTMLDVNPSFLEASLHRLRRDYPRVAFRGIVGDFTADLSRLGPGGRRLTVLFAGTLGNLHPHERRAFFQELALGMEASDALLLGVDLVKDDALLTTAYDDPEGVTAAFDRNALRVINRRFGGDFDPDAFAHRALYDADNAWIEMRLRAQHRMHVRLSALDLDLDFPRGAEIRTEVSCKFTRASLAAAAREGGLALARFYTDPAELFALAILRRSDA